MKEWLKVFGLGFFDDRLAAKSGTHGFFSVFLAIVLSFLFFMFGFMAADVVPFSSHYDKAGQYRDFLRNAVSASDLTVEIGGGAAKSDSIVNTYTNESDKEKYGINGYDLIIDTRASDMLIDFEQVAVDGDAEIDYRSYLALSERERSAYKIETRYTDRALELTDEKVADFTAYLDEISKEGGAEYNSSAAEAYGDIQKSDLSADDYNREIYYLYVRYYYTDLQSSLMSAKAPVLCDYYYLNFILNGNENYFYMFDDICAGYFVTDKNVPAMFSGYYRDCEEGVLDGDSIDRLVKDVYYSSVGYFMSSYFTGAMQMAPAYVLIPVLAGLLLFVVCKFTKKRFGEKFIECYKTVNTFTWFSALLTGLLTFILGFFVFSRKLYLFMPLIFAAILIFRTLVFYITRSVEEKRTVEQDEYAESAVQGSYQNQAEG